MLPVRRAFHSLAVLMKKLFWCSLLLISLLHRHQYQCPCLASGQCHWQFQQACAHIRCHFRSQLGLCMKYKLVTMSAWTLLAMHGIPIDPRPDPQVFPPKVRTSLLSWWVWAWSFIFLTQANKLYCFYNHKTKQNKRDVPTKIKHVQVCLYVCSKKCQLFIFFIVALE